MLETSERNEMDEIKRVVNGMGAAQQEYMNRSDKHQEILERLEGWMQSKGMAVQKTV